ncbi:MAG: TniQ family protein [Nitrobacter sp.]
MAICLSKTAARFLVEPQPRYRDMQPDRWPVTIAPQDDELLSSWLHRLALANGLAPRHLSDVLGCGAGMWSARLDLKLPDGMLDVLHQQTDVARERILRMTLSVSAGARLLLPLRHVAGRRAATWLQFCPQCLAGDDAPYFRRRWRWATRISCWEHGCGLRDRCPRCGDGIAAFAQRDLIAQHFCRHCGHDLRIAARVRVLAATRRKARLIDDLCRFEAARGFPASSSLTRRLIDLPHAISPVVAHALTQLSVAARIGCIERIDGGLTPLLHDDVTIIAFWRDRIVRAGGMAETLEPLCLRLAMQREGCRKTHQADFDTDGLDLTTLSSAYAAVLARRQRKLAVRNSANPPPSSAALYDAGTTSIP